MFRFDQIVPIKIKRLENCFDIPKYKTDGAVAMDLYAAEDVYLRPNQRAMVRTGIAIALPEGFEAQIRARSGMAAKGIIVLNGPGTVDFDYRGEILVLLANIGTISLDEYHEACVNHTKKVVFDRGPVHQYEYLKNHRPHVIEYYQHRQFQAIAKEDNLTIPFEEVEAKTHIITRGDRIAQMSFAPVYRGVFTEVDSLSETERGEGGFGHTGR